MSGSEDCSLIPGVSRCPQCKATFPSKLYVLSGPRLIDQRLCDHHHQIKQKSQLKHKDKKNARCLAAYHDESSGIKKKQRERRATEAGKLARKEEAKREALNGKAAARVRKFKAIPENKPKIAKQNSTPRALMKRSQAHARRMEDPAYKLMFCIASKVSRMLRVGGLESSTVQEYTSINSSNALHAHLKSTFPSDGSMTWANYGRKSVSQEDAKNGRYWEVGHIIARSMYNPKVEADVRKCWSPMNLFAQNGPENLKAQTSLPSNEKLLEMRHLWPTCWSGQLPSVERRIVLERFSKRGKQPPEI